MFTGLVAGLLVKIALRQGLVQLLFFLLQCVSLLGNFRGFVFYFFAQAVDGLLKFLDFCLVVANADRSFTAELDRHLGPFGQVALA